MKTKHTRIGTTLMVSVAMGGLTTFAQAAKRVAPTPPPPAAPSAAAEKSKPTEPGGTGESTATTTTLAWADRDFLQKAMELHTSGAELAKLADKNAGTEEVQALGEELLAEHARSVAALKEIARAKDVEASAEPTASQQATISAFTAKIGHTFDEDYRAEALKNHEKAIHLFTEAAKSRDPEIRAYAERSLGEMKERHAALGGEAVKIKGSIAPSLPKPAKSLPPEKAPARNVKTKTPAVPSTQLAQAQPQSQAQPQVQQAPRRPAPRPIPVSHFVQNLDGTYSIVEPTDPRLTNPYAQPALNGQYSAQTTTDIPATQTTSDPRALWRVPRDFTDNDRRLARQPSMNVILAGPSQTTPKPTTRSATQDLDVASAPVARVVIPSDQPPTVVRRVPATRTFRIFNFNDD